MVQISQWARSSPEQHQLFTHSEIKMNRLATISMIKIALVALALVSTTRDGRAAEIVVLCAEALESSMVELIPEFEKTSGQTVKITFANVGTNAERVRQGDAADLAIVLPRQWEVLQKEGKIDPAVRVVIGKVGIGVFVKKGAARPDIGSTEAFKRALLDARAIAVRDPAARSPVGAYIIALVERLGVASEVKPKLHLTTDRPYQAVVSGGAAFGFSTMAEILASSEVDLVGPLPNDIQNFNIFTTAIPVGSKQRSAAKSLIEFLTSARTASVFKTHGIDTN
jgi:molybdate transport system substrate-binding protein